MTKPITPTDEEVRRFSGRLVRTSECWLWPGKKASDGYGRVWTRAHGFVLAHRLAYTVWREPIPDGLRICHHCDNPPCCNPSHLFVGTQLRNIRDMVAKGRQRGARGSRNKNSKLTEDLVRQIRRRLADGESTTAIGRSLGLHRNTIWHIKSRHSWWWLD